MQGAAYLAGYLFQAVARGGPAYSHLARGSLAAVHRARVAKGVASGAAVVGGLALLASGKGREHSQQKSHSVKPVPMMSRGSKARKGNDGVAVYRRKARVQRKQRFGKQKQIFRDKGGYTQFSKVSGAVVGASMGAAVTCAKLLMASCRTFKDRWQLLSAPAATTYSLPLSFSLDTAGPTNTATLPFYIWDLTGLESGQMSGSIFSAPCQRLTRWGNGQRYIFEPVAQRLADDTADVLTWVPENPLTSPAEITFHPKQLVTDVRADMLIMGATSRPSRVTVEVWQFTNENLVPPARIVSTLRTNASTLEDTDKGVEAAEELGEWNQFWLQNTDELTSNPLIKRGNTSAPVKGHKVLFTKTFEFQPIETDENDTRGHQVQWALTQHLDKILNFAGRENYQGTVNLAFKDEDVYDTGIAAGNMRAHIRKLSRVYLVVKGLTFGDDGAAGTTASFDILMRRTRKVLIGANDI